jgi:hypothetical protein
LESIPFSKDSAFEWEAMTLLVHMAEVERESNPRHTFQQGIAIPGQGARLMGAAAEARSGPGRADHAHASLPPLLQFSRFLHSFGAFHQENQTDRRDRRCCWLGIGFTGLI